jgi:hypothetical protein
MVEQCIRRRAGIFEAEIDAEIVGLDLEQGTCFGFNSTATRVWQLLEEPKTRRQLRDVLISEFDVDAQTCEEQLDALIGELEGMGLVESVPGEGDRVPS